MNKKLVRLTESDLHRIVKESVNKILNEWGDQPDLAAQLNNNPPKIPNFDRNKGYEYLDGEWMDTASANKRWKEKEQEHLRAQEEETRRKVEMSRLSEEAEQEMRKYVITKKELEKQFPYLLSMQSGDRPIEDNSELLILYHVIVGWILKQGRKLSVYAAKKIENALQYGLMNFTSDDVEIDKTYDMFMSKVDSITDKNFAEPKFYREYIDNKLGRQ